MAPLVKKLILHLGHYHDRDYISTSETQIISIISELSNLPLPGANELKHAYGDYEKDHQLVKLIDAVTKYIPSSLFEFSDNPLKLLHAQTSSGIHELNRRRMFNPGKVDRHFTKVYYKEDTRRKIRKHGS